MEASLGSSHQKVISPPSSLNPLPSSTFSSPPPKLDQKTFKTTIRSGNYKIIIHEVAIPIIRYTQHFIFFPMLHYSSFNSTSSSVQTKKRQQSRCIPLWQLKIGEPVKWTQVITALKIIIKQHEWLLQYYSNLHSIFLFKIDSITCDI